eukprot:3404531-Pleurochrysis_carterae.AAC.2
MSPQQMTADLLPFPAFHVPDVSGRVGSDPSHEERALKYGTPGWSSASYFPFPDAAWLRRGKMDAEPGPIYRLAHSYVYNRYHPVPLETLSSDTRVYPGLVEQEFQALRAACSHTPHEQVVDINPGRIFDASGEASAYFETDISNLVLTYAREALMVARLPLRTVCRAFPRLQANHMVADYVPPSEDSLTKVSASLELPAVMGVVPIPARVRSTALLLQTLESRSQEKQRPDEMSPAHALLPRLCYLQASPTNGSVAVAALEGG